MPSAWVDEYNIDYPDLATFLRTKALWLDVCSDSDVSRVTRTRNSVDARFPITTLQVRVVSFGMHGMSTLFR